MRTLLHELDDRLRECSYSLKFALEKRRMIISRNVDGCAMNNKTADHIARMPLTEEELNSFHDHGLLFQTYALSNNLISAIVEQVDGLTTIDVPSRIMERDGRTVRALHGCHLMHPLFERLIRLPILLGLAKQILGSDVYLYQFKINLKAAFRGDVWPWHQDYIFWRNEDGMLRPRALNVIIFLDDVTEFNGPIYFMPGSHHEGCIDVPAANHNHTSNWRSNVTADLKYRIDDERLAAFAQRYGLISPKGPRGSVVFSHCNIIHASPSNITPFSRRLVIITYNAVDNVPCSKAPIRPDFLVGRDVSSLQMLESNTLAIDDD
jgi:Phytanoyl-CoA dioxygenase (PhyH)